MAVVLAYLCFLPIAALCFARLPLRSAILLVLIGGWLLLPVARYGPGAPGTDTPWWITGIALPSDMLVTKAWIPSLVAFAGAAVCDQVTLRRWRPRFIDLPMTAWCLWPLVDRIGTAADPPAWVAALYVTGAWGLPWLIGRIWLVGPENGRAVLRALALSGLANVPVAVVEAVRPGWFYGLLYGPHPYRFDGIDRYVWHRPIGFLENGNLYGLWAALAAFAAVSLLRDEDARDWRWEALAAVNVAVALTSQSVGAIMLLGAGLALLALWRLPLFLPLLAALAMLVVLAAAVHFSGVVPVQSLARTPAGERVIGAMRSIGRGSFLWRVSQDSKTLASVAAHPIGGNVHWDWWRPYGTRPWGQAMLLLGQYGLVGLALAWGALVGAAAAAFVRLRRLGGWRTSDPALPLAILVLLALADAALNAFFFAPAILAAGAIAGSSKRWR